MQSELILREAIAKELGRCSVVLMTTGGINEVGVAALMRRLEDALDCADQARRKLAVVQ